jgi:hypothetical protein
MVGSTAAAGGGLNYGVGPSVMQIELARTKCSKCMIKFLCGRRSVRLRWGIAISILVAKQRGVQARLTLVLRGRFTPRSRILPSQDTH